MSSPLIKRAKANLQDETLLNYFIVILASTIIGGMLALAITPR